MAPKKVTTGEKPKRKIVISMIEMKQELITTWEGGKRLSDLAAQYGMANVVERVKFLTSKISPAVEVKKLLMVWINEKQVASDSV
jgi:hypothetical protein